ncbi:Cytochrome b subunit of formate dehydrogenase-like protein [Solidesulfovibrio fructosivorans JJ]]|uniref:Cytochrome b subunit of formate dehydrogenase-like protein n=1 Tax=Solidesulfovibrio fructosivorans JJ] TaxID=596151 RepID=E1JTQ1_SOLFR|nr:cytochrome b/b6 domain-containing protein [Solidesulfovibrio fructosivorans]EFL52180.1 Cytochrome b subunit of formate dehydrogenase-like protein [Solidesulfovibrio fructosivorans JJ]]
MNLVTWGASPWGQPIILHAAWYLLWYSLAAGVLFVLAHAVWAHLRPHAPEPAASPGDAARYPAGIVRHTLPARLFHWVMAACMLTLLATAFLPKIGWSFDWLGAHVLAGSILVAAIVFHIVHAVCCLDFRAIWPEPADLAELRDLSGIRAPARPGKYPLGNKLYHLAIVVVGLTMAITGACMLTRVRTDFMTRDPYRYFSDGGWGVVYALHGLAGLSLIALVIIHVYFAARPEKRPITRAMITGRMDRAFYLSHHDPARWNAGPKAAK